MCLAWLSALLACEVAPAARVDRPILDRLPPVAARPEVVAVEVAAPIDALLADRYPSLEFYPGCSAPLAAALARPDGPREIVAGIAESLAPYRWPGPLDWDRQGFIDLHGPHPGFVTRVSGTLIGQPGDRHDLGCAGGFLEGVRLTLLPRLAIDDLDRCSAPTCDREHTYGRLALGNIAALLSPEQLPGGPGLVEVDLHDRLALDLLSAPGAMHLCTVSHESGRNANARYYHHLLIVLGTTGGTLDIFDTTGIRGVSLVSMARAHFVRYCSAQLAASQEYRYSGRSAQLTCLPVALTPAR